MRSGAEIPYAKQLIGDGGWTPGDVMNWYPDTQLCVDLCWICLSMQELQGTQVWSPGQEDKPWWRKWKPTPVFLLGKSHGQSSLVGYSPRGREELNTIEPTHTALVGVLFRVIIDLFMAVLGLHCFVLAFFLWPSGGSQPCMGFSPRWLLLLWSTGSGALAQNLWCTGLVAPRHVGSSRTRNGTRVPFIGRCILHHWTTREVLFFIFFFSAWRHMELPQPGIEPVSPARDGWSLNLDH